MKKKMPLSKEDAFIREVTEELKNDNLKLLWKKYGLYITIGIVILLTAAVSFETIKSWRIKQHQSWSDTYAYALALQNQGRFTESLEVLDKIEKSGNNIYADIAKMQSANIMFEQGRTDDALAILEEIVKSRDVNEKIKDMAIIKLASYKLDSAPAEEVANLLNPLIKKNNSWNNIAKEMMAMLAIREGNIEQAKTLYNEILNSGKLNEGLQSRVKDMVSILNSEK